MNALFLALALAAHPGTIERDGPRPFGPKFDAGVSIYPVHTDGVERKLPPFQLGKTPPLAQEVHDMVFLATKRPIKIRLRVGREDGPLTGPWLAEVRKLFRYFDRDNNDSLNAHELEFALSVRNVQVLLAGSYALRTSADPVTLKEADRDRDGRVSFDEYATYLNGATAALVRVAPNFTGDPYAATLTKDLFAMLDANADAKLSRAEVGRIESFLKRDDDEDECVSALELVPNLYSRQVAVVQPRARTPAAPAPVGPLTIAPAGQIPPQVLQQVVTQYDADKDGALSREEVGFDAEAFDKLDVDRDGKLNASELEGWRRGRADAELALNWGEGAGKSTARLDAVQPGAGLELVHNGERWLLRVGPRQHIDITATTTPSVPVAQLVNQFGLGQQFQFADTKNAGFVTEKDIGAGPQFQFIRIVFDAADRDADGKLTRAEYDAYFTAQLSFGAVSMAVNYSTEVLSLFSALDADRDGRLSVREMRKAWDRLKEMQPSAADEVTTEILQPQGALTFGRGSPGAAFARPVGTIAVPVAARVPGEGPVWFRKMDRNGDGEVSRVEFLGTPDEFRLADADQDGLISRSEGEAVSKVKTP